MVNEEQKPNRCDICGNGYDGTGTNISGYNLCGSGKCMAAVIKCPDGDDPKEFYKTLVLGHICEDCGKSFVRSHKCRGASK